MKLSREEVLHISRLARLGVTDADIDKHIAAFDDIAASLAKAQAERSERVPAEVAH